VLGKPQTNGLILRLNQLGALPVPVRERQLSLGSLGPAAVAPGDMVTYTLTLTNTTQQAVYSLSLIDSLPAYAQLVGCSPACAEGMQGREVSWLIPVMQAGATFQCALIVRLGEEVVGTAVENTAHLLDVGAGLLNANTLTTTVNAVLPPGPALVASVSAGDGYLFAQGERAIPEQDGIVQELVSPWDQTRAILVVTGLSDAAVGKASQAMSSESHFPGMRGTSALVREVHALPEISEKPPAPQLTFADLGYDDALLESYSEEANYYFDIPVSWVLTQKAYLDLHFSHSRLLDYGDSSLSVLFNDEPLATISLSDETSLNGTLRVGLSSAKARPGKANKISIQAQLRLFDECAHVDRWLLVSNTSLLYLDHAEQDMRSLDLDFYPRPFDRRADMADVLFVLPAEPQVAEWEVALQLAAALGGAAGGTDLAPAVLLGEQALPEQELSDYHLIAMGRPSRNAVLRRVNAQLPQPFRPGSDEIEQQIDEVVFRLPPGLSLGFVQLIPSPWNETRALLAVTGTTDESVKWAVDTLTGRARQVNGNLVLISEDQIHTLDTHQLVSGGLAAAMATAVPEMTPVAPVTGTITSSPKPGSSAAEGPSAGWHRPVWLVPLVGVVGLAVIAIFAIAFRQARRRSTN
jgi:uncharacterized repeat protein (TIGR01451 family)